MQIALRFQGRLSRWLRQPDTQIALGLLLLAALLMAPYLAQPGMLLWPRSGLGSDLITYNWPSAEYMRQAARQDGQIALWWGTTLGGIPLAGNPGVRVFYPPHFALILLPVPLPTALALVNTLSLWVAGIGAYGLARAALRIRRGAALVTALLVMLTPRISANLVGDMFYTAGLCWVPLALWCFRMLLDRRTWRWAIAAGAALALLAVLNFVMIVYVGLLLAAYTLLVLIETLRGGIRRRWPDVLRLLGLLALVGAVAFGLAAFHLLPLLSYLPYQIREAMTLADASYLSLPLPFLIHVLFPSPFKFPEWEVYMGLLPLLLAPLAARHPHRREALIWLAVLVFAVVFALGDATPLYALIVYGVPGFRLLRAPARMWLFAALALAMLAGLGLDHLLGGGSLSARGRRWLAGGASVLAISGAAGRYIYRLPAEADWLLGLLAAAGVLLAMWALLGRHPRPRLAALLVAAVLLDLAPLDMVYGRPEPVSEVFAMPPIGRRLLDAVGEGSLIRVYSVRRELGDHLLTAYGLQSADGLNSFQFAGYSRLMRIASGCRLDGLAAAVPPCASNEIDPDAYREALPNPALLGLLNVGYIISPLELPAHPDLQLIATAGEERLYRNRAVLPRAFALGRAEVLPEADLWARMASLDPRAGALLDADQVLGFAPPDNDFFTPAQIVLYTPNELRIDVDMPGDGLLVVGEAWVPGWQARVDGQPAPVLRVDGALRGLYLPAGVHHVRLVFMPPALQAGLVLLGVTSLACAAALLLDRLRARPRPGTG